jgi:hypothetical protein
MKKKYHFHEPVSYINVEAEVQNLSLRKSFFIEYNGSVILQFNVQNWGLYLFYKTQKLPFYLGVDFTNSLIVN